MAEGEKYCDDIFDDYLIDVDEILENVDGSWIDDLGDDDFDGQITAADIAAADPFSDVIEESIKTVETEEVLEDDAIFLRFDPAVEKDPVLQKFEEVMEEDEPEDVVKEKKNEKQPKMVHTSEYGFSEIADRVIEKNHIVCHNHELYFYNGHCYTKLVDKVLKQKIMNEMSKEQKNSFSFRSNRNSIVEAIKENAAIDLQLNKIKPSKNVVTFKNGNLDLETGEFFDFTHEVMTMYEVNANYVPDMAYLPTPKWDAFITSAIEGDAREVLNFIYTILGYLLIPGAPAKKFFVFGTAPDSGKSVFGDFVTFLLGDENVSGVELNQFKRNFVFSEVAGKVVNIAMDLADVIISFEAVARLKSLSGHDRVSMEKKHQLPFTIGVETKFVFGTNAPLKLKKHDKAFFNRLIVVPFMHSVPEEEQNWDLIDELKAERDFIVTKAMQAVMELRKKNYNFPIIEASAKLHREWSRTDADIAADTIEEFVKAWCKKTDDMTDFITAEDLFEYYVDFCDIHGYKTVQRTLFPQLMEKYFPKKRASYTQDGTRYQPRGFQYIKIRAS